MVVCFMNDKVKGHAARSRESDWLSLVKILIQARAQAGAFLVVAFLFFFFVPQIEHAHGEFRGLTRLFHMSCVILSLVGLELNLGTG